MNILNLPARFFRNRIVQVGIVVMLVCLAIWQIARITELKSLAELSSTGRLRVNLYAGSLRDTLEKYRHLPYVLARNQRIIELLHNSIPALRVNPHLEDFARTTGALIYVLDQGGTTVATSNWRQNSSLLGHNYSFRPYFTAARDGRAGGYYAVGMQTRQPGFFLSYPVKDNGTFLGVIVVKVDLEPMQEAWKRSGEAVIVSDAFGVIFLTSNPSWKYTSLRPLPDHSLERLQALQYLDAPLPALAMERQLKKGFSILKLGETRYLEQAMQLPEYGWRIHYLTDLAIVENNARLAIIISTIVTSLIFLTLLYMRERRQKLLSRQEARKAKAVADVNERLRQEIARHRQTEEDLRKTQKELIQAGKLAALGRMSAAIAHELNQPVSAIRTFLASCTILLERGRIEEVEKNLGFIAGLTDRMASITGQLKTFARKSTAREEIVDIGKTLKNVVQTMEPQLDRYGVRLEEDIGDDIRTGVRGDSLQLEQVLSNLLHNGLDAVKEVEDRCIHLGLTEAEGRIRLEVADNGPGIAEEALDALFDPFFTTKEIGKGLGLGLSISYGIIQDLQGSIRAENRPQGGARFIVELPLAEEGGA